MDWEDVKTFAEVAKDGTVRAAAKTLGVHHSTVSRRVERLESALAARLFDRHPEGYVLTEAGVQLSKAASEASEVFRVAERQIAGGDTTLSGRVRITMAEPVAVSCFAPRLPAFFERYPDLDLEICITGDILDISRGDAEVAVRMDNNPPETLVGKRLFPYFETVFASPAYLEKVRSPGGAESARWLGWGAEEAVFRESVKDTEFSNAPVWGVYANLSMQAAAARAGLGLAMLPCVTGDQDPELIRATCRKPRPARDIWILTHPDLRRVARVRAVMEFAEATLRETRPYFTGDPPV
ncbi:MAG: LysR family transcriptional regulator [Pseudomonadota bacterium]